MKKYIILILSFFAFIGSCSAIEVTSENIDAVIKNDGSADVTINCTLLPQRESVYKIPFFNVENSKITNISIEDNLNSHYEEADSIEDNKALFALHYLKPPVDFDAVFDDDIQ